MPVMGELPDVPNFFVMHLSAGFTLGPIAGMVMADLVRTGQTSLSIDAFRPARQTELVT